MKLGFVARAHIIAGEKLPTSITAIQSKTVGIDKIQYKSNSRQIGVLRAIQIGNKH